MEPKGGAIAAGRGRLPAPPLCTALSVPQRQRDRLLQRHRAAAHGRFLDGIGRQDRSRGLDTE